MHSCFVCSCALWCFICCSILLSVSQLPRNVDGERESSATPPSEKRPLDLGTAASIADALMDDSGPDLDSLIDRMLTLTPSTPLPSEMMKELDRLERENSRDSERESEKEEETGDSVDVPPELPPKQRPPSTHSNGDLLHLGENGAVPSSQQQEETPTTPKAPPRKKSHRDKDPDSVSVFFLCLLLYVCVVWHFQCVWSGFVSLFARCVWSGFVVLFVRCVWGGFVILFVRCVWSGFVILFVRCVWSGFVILFVRCVWSGFVILFVRCAWSGFVVLFVRCVWSGFVIMFVRCVWSGFVILSGVSGVALWFCLSGIWNDFVILFVRCVWNDFVILFVRCV